jgi:dethiobiotin synthetase
VRSNFGFSVQRVIIVGTGTGIGKTHVTCALIRAAIARGIQAVGLKPIETGLSGWLDASSDGLSARAAGVENDRGVVEARSAWSKASSHPDRAIERELDEPPWDGERGSGGPGRGLMAPAPGDQERLTMAAAAARRGVSDEVAFHVKRSEAHASREELSASSKPDGVPSSRSPFHVKPSTSSPRAEDGSLALPQYSSERPVKSWVAGGTFENPRRTSSDHLAGWAAAIALNESSFASFEASASVPDVDARASREPAAFHVKRPLYGFADPVSPHLAALRSGVRFDFGAIRRWVGEHSQTLTFIETAGGLFSPLGHATTNVDLVQALLPAVVLLVAPDRLGVLHDVAATVGLASARRRPIDAVLLSAPEQADASTGTNAEALTTLEIALPLAVFPRAPEDDPATLVCAGAVLDWLTSNRVLEKSPLHV